MDDSKTSLAIVLSRSDYRESDSLLVVYTRDFGKLTLVARGAKKLNSKLSGYLEPFSLVEILIIPGRGFDYIGSVSNREVFLSLRDNLNKLYYAGLALKNFNRLVRDNQKDERLFLLLQRFLESLDSYLEEKFSKESGELLYIFFALKLLAELGYRPELYECLSCRKKIKKGKNYFNLKNGGLICLDCFNKEYVIYKNNGPKPAEILTISDNCIKLMRFILDNRLDVAYKLKLEKKFIQELSRLVANFLNFYS